MFTYVTYDFGFPDFFQPESDSDIEDCGDTYRIAIDMPGIPKDAISIELKDGVLSVSGERKIEKKKVGDYGRWSGQIVRKFTLPRNINTADISAKCADGVLFIDVIKPQTMKPTKIAIAP